VAAVVVVVDFVDFFVDFFDFFDRDRVVVVVVVALDDGGAVEVVVVVVAAGVVVVVALAGAVVVVVVVVGGVTNGVVSPRSVAWLAVGVADRFVELCAAFQLCRAVAAGVPLRGCGSPSTMVAGRKVAETMCRPTAVTRSDPLSVSGAVSS
jgi:hypothetical protein